MALNAPAWLLANAFTKDTANEFGAVKGAPCTVGNVAFDADGNTVVELVWTNSAGQTRTTPATIKKGEKGDIGEKGADGSDGIGISKIEKISTVDLVDTYRITFTDNSTFDYEVTNGKDGQGGGTADIPIEKIKVNGELQTPVNKVVDITVPDAYDDTALVQRISDIESDYAKSSDIPSLSGYATETWINEQGFLTQHQDLSNYATKDELPSLDGYATESYVTEQISNIPSVDLTDYAKKNEIPDVSGYITEEQLFAKDYADKAYVTEEIAKASTGGEIDLSAYLSKVEATEIYVTKESGKSLVSDAEIARLASVDNYDDTEIRTELANKADTTAIPSKVSELTNDSNYQTAEQVNSTVTTEIAKVVADAPEDLNTLKEMSDWIAGHEDDVSAMNSAISDNKTAIITLQTSKADKSEIPTTVAELTDSADYAKKTDLHSHDNKTILDGITSTKVSDWDTAKTHADSAHARTDATNVSASTTNGNIKINGIETNVYIHPSGTNPHGTTKSDVGLGNVGNFKAVSTVASQGLTDTEKSNARANIGAGTSSFSGSYNDLSNKPTIPNEVTESTVSGWGFTKNTGTYSKPTGGIPKSDLTSTVQSSLDKADTALQSHQSLADYVKTTDSRLTDARTPTEHTHSVSEITNFPTSMTPTAHNQASNTITAMSGYTKASSVTAISTSDSLNTAIGKLEKALDSKQASGSYATASHTHDDRYYTETEINTKLNTKLNTSLKGVANGLAELDSSGKVPTSQLPSYVDDVIEGYLYNSKFYKESTHTTAISGETGKIYIDLSTNKTYRWSGSAFVVISETLALGETSSTAYRGDRGKIAYEHSQSTHARTDATKVEKSSTNGNIKINGTETTVYTHPSGTNPHGTTKSDVGLGNVPNVATNDQTPNYTEATKLAKLTSGEKLSVAFGKISKAITDLISHIGDSVKHITSTERTNWGNAYTHSQSAHAPSNAQANVIETIKVNGTVLTPSSKAVNITVPTGTAANKGVDTSIATGSSSTNLPTSKAVSAFVDNKLDSWFSQTKQATATGEQSVVFTGLDTTKAYELWFETTDGSQVSVKSSSLSGTTMTYIINIPTDCPVPVNFKLRVIK